MAFSINRATLVGNAGKDAEVRYTGSGVPVATFSIATTESWTDKNSGQKQERTEWHNIKAWNWLAEYCNENVKKGKRVFVEGRITSRSYDDKDGNKKYITEIEASTVMTMERTQAGDNGGGGYRQNNQSHGNQGNYGGQQNNYRSNAPTSAPAPVPDYEPQDAPVDDLPF